MSIQVAITTDEDQDEKLQQLLTIMNEQLLAQGRPTFANVNEMARDALVSQLKGWYKMADDTIVEQFKALFEAADYMTREECMNILRAPEGE
jgi:hypothetical protein